MTDKPEAPAHDPRLNPALKNRTDATHDTSISSPAPAESASVQHEEGRHWPWVWAVVVLVGIVVVLWILFL